jgi:predicted dithiol-disulfide oxidoreductase (DUF899 family)
VRALEHVASRTLAEAPADITVITGYLREHVRRLEAEDGRSIWPCGGSTLAGQLLPEIDRVLLEVSPVVLGTGLPLSAGDPSVARFALTAVRSSTNGVVLLVYATVEAAPMRSRAHVGPTCTGDTSTAPQQREETAMEDRPPEPGGPAAGATRAPSVPAAVDRATFQAELDELRAREKAHTREGDAIAAARRRLPVVEVDADTELIGPSGPVTLLDAFDGRRQLIAYYSMWYSGHPAAEQCEGCTWVTTQVAELSYLHSRDITYAVFCQGPYEESSRYRDFMGWDIPWYSAQGSLDTLLVGRHIGLMHLVCYLRDGDRVFETYWTTRRGVEAMDYSYALMDLTVYGRQEPWEDSPPGWPRPWQVDGSNTRINGRPIAQWSRLEAGRSDDLTVGP